MTHDQRERLKGGLHGLQSSIRFTLGGIRRSMERIRIEIGQGLNERANAHEKDFDNWLALNRDYYATRSRREADE